MKRHLLKLFFALMMFGIQVPFAFASPTDSGLDIRVAMGMPISFQAYKHGENPPIEWGMGYEHHFDNTYLMIGANTELSFGYRWTYFGLYYDQELIYSWPAFTCEDCGAGQKGFFGGSYITGRAILPVAEQVQLDFGIGLGIMYSEVLDYNINGSDLKIGSDVAFAAKANISFLYYFTDWFSMGASLDYSLGIQREFRYKLFVDSPHQKSYKNWDRLILHNLTPGLLLSFKI